MRDNQQPARIFFKQVRDPFNTRAVAHFRVLFRVIPGLDLRLNNGAINSVGGHLSVHYPRSVYGLDWLFLDSSQARFDSWVLQSFVKATQHPEWNTDRFIEIMPEDD